MTARLDAVFKVVAGLDPSEAATLLVQLVPELDLEGMARLPVAWFSRLTEIAKVDPFAAGQLASAMYCHLAAHRPESPAPLDAGFEPTEIARDPRD
ncbi:MAG: hypothetical protein M3680_14560 [Myxococcota bacterium]|nr:hypothetical protein [Myxococcota bacterium]